MTSTEFTVGLDGSRASSKVLRPPGGGSSDIFGMGSVQNNTPRAKPARGGGGGYSDIFGVGPAQNSAPRNQPEPPSAQEAPASQPEPPSMPEPVASSQPEAPSTPETQPEVPSTPETAASSQPEPVSAAESNASLQNTPAKPQSAYAQTQNRLFGGGDPTFTPGRRQIKTNMFAHQTPLAPPPPRTTYVRHNPITGEEIIMNVEKAESNGKEDINSNVHDNYVQECNDGEVKTEEEPAPKPVTTSIRVRNPPGGHSSGIF